MASQKILHHLQLDNSDDFPIGLVKCSQNLPFHEFFYALNLANTFYFERKKDLVVETVFFDYHFLVFEAYCEINDIRFRFFGNSPIHKVQTKDINELFSEDTGGILLFPDEEISYVTTSSYNSPDFSLILQTENSIFHLDNYLLNFEDNLYHLIQHYE